MSPQRRFHVLLRSPVALPQKVWPGISNVSITWGSVRNAECQAPLRASESEPEFCEHWPGHGRSYAPGALRRQKPPVPGRQLPSSSLSMNLPALGSPLLSLPLCTARAEGPHFAGSLVTTQLLAGESTAESQGGGRRKEQPAGLPALPLTLAPHLGAAPGDRLSPVLAPL